MYYQGESTDQLRATIEEVRSRVKAASLGKNWSTSCRRAAREMPSTAHSGSWRPLRRVDPGLARVPSSHIVG